VVSIVTITRAALTHSAQDSRRELLFELASNEGIRIYPLEETDRIIAPTDSPLMPLMPLIQSNVKERLGKDTKFAGLVNDVAGFWVSFKIEDDEYWLMLDRDRIARTTSIQWIGWGTITLLLSLIGAVFISRLINQPLANLAAAARAIAKGQQPVPLPESGTTEIMEANRSFNQMVDDLQRIESDRAVILAGISHDLRTPITRMLLEVEMANLSEEARLGMQSDLAQMDAIIGQFLDFAKPSDNAQFEVINLSALMNSAFQDAMRFPDAKVQANIEDNINILGNAVELRRVINNLIENAHRYGKNTLSQTVEITIHCRLDNGQAIVEIADHGCGIPESDINQLIRPFTRSDSARGQANGAGLGLAIVDRVIKKHQGKLSLTNRVEGGLLVKISMQAKI